MSYETELDELRRTVARLEAQLLNKHPGSSLPGLDIVRGPRHEGGNIIGMLSASNDYTVDATATMELHNWNATSLMQRSWKKASVQWRVTASLLLSEKSRRGLDKYTRKDWLRDYAQGELDV